MCNILMWARGSDSTLTPRQRTTQPERGDVIDVNDDDDFHWGLTPENSPEFQVVIIPGAKAADFAALQENNYHLVEVGTVAWRHRIWTVNMDLIGKDQLSLPNARWVVSAELFKSAVSMKDAAQTHDNRGRILTTLG